ncbi:DUF6489 family protein [Marichromatium gracile]|uniref:DUF6489 family protein n=1 Tax=Marichromatium gracile TaxID=1048 RepID=UPI001F3782DF|nr:DUF6489 family protein [Marichromatium gracile]MCF1183015.1 DUF6489 family protein [Marichromatium gracile]
MKIKVDVEMTPEEMRKLFGLPDVEAFQRQLLDEIGARISEGAEGYEPLKLFQPYMNSTLASWEMFHRMMGGVASAERRSSESDD